MKKGYYYCWLDVSELAGAFPEELLDMAGGSKPTPAPPLRLLMVERTFGVLLRAGLLIGLELLIIDCCWR